MTLNLGSTIGTILTPILRTNFKCFGNDCYPLAFGIPNIMMLVGILVFVLGTPFYKSEQIKKENVITKTIGCIFYAVKSKIKNLSSGNKKEHWLDYAEDKYSGQLIKDIKIFLKVCFVFVPIPIFWALYDQQGSRWTEQAQQLNGRVGSVIIKPDQFQALNPIFIVILVPIFDKFIYPAFAKFNLLKNLLQRMIVGLSICVLSFFIAAFLEYKMTTNSLSLNPSNQINLINLSPCDLNIDNIADLPKSSYLNNAFSLIADNASIHIELKPLNWTLAYLVVIKLGYTPILNSTYADFTSFKIFCPSREFYQFEYIFIHLFV